MTSRQRTSRQRLSADRFFEDKICLVTGGANGIGYAIARALAEHGGIVHVCDKSEGHLRRAAGELEASSDGSRVRLQHADVTDRAAMAKWVDAVVGEHGGVDILINNASYIRWETVDKMTVEDAELSMATNYNALLYTTSSVLPVMREQKKGAIVTIGSSAGKVFTGGQSAAYAAAKAAVDAYTAVLRQDLHGSGIDTMIVRPGLVAGTDFFGTHVSSSKVPRLTDFMPALTPAEVAAAVVRGIVAGRRSVDIPATLPLFYLLYTLSPRLVERISASGGGARKDYGALVSGRQPQQHAPSDR
jgi:NADP-dependent 3-hydroxy acid dehydrogenase YdfG